MAEKRFTDTLDEKLALISPTVKAIEFGGDRPDLGELQTLLRQHLASLVVLFERDPGLDAATADLYAAAAAIVNDSTRACQPLARKRRLLKHASTSASRRHARMKGTPLLRGGEMSSSLPPNAPWISHQQCGVPEPRPLHTKRDTDPLYPSAQSDTGSCGAARSCEHIQACTLTKQFSGDFDLGAASPLPIG